MACIVQKFKTKLPLTSQCSIFPHLACNKLAILSTKGELTIVDIVKDNVSHRNVMKNIASFCWMSCSNSEEEEIRLTGFCVYETSGQIKIHCIENGSVKEILEINQSSIRHLLQEQDIQGLQFDILSYQGHVVCFGCENNQVVSLTLEDGDRPEVLSVLSLTHISPNPGGIRKYKVKHGTLLTFDHSYKKIFVYSILSGSLLAWLDLSPVLEEAEWWEMSDDLQYFSFISKTEVVHISIDLFVETHPHCVRCMEIPSSESNFRNISALKAVTAKTYVSTTLGDSVWRSQVSDLLTKHRKWRAGPWFLGSRSNHTDSSNPQLPKTDSSRVSGFHKMSPVERLQPANIGVHRMTVPLDTGQTLWDLAVSFNGVDLKCFSQESFTLYSLQVDKDIKTETYDTGQILVLSKTPGYPHFLLSERCMTSVGWDTQQEQLVSRVMLYGGAGAADVLCHLNKWDRCTIPINTLETGLKHRQLDTVSFFLRSKEKLFSTNTSKTCPLSPSDSASSSGSFSWVPSYSHEENFAQVEPALNLLVQSVQDNVSDPQSRQFAERLLAITLNCLYGLQADALLVIRDRWGVTSLTTEQQEEVQVLENIVENLMSKIIDLRKCLHLPLTKVTPAQKMPVDDTPVTSDSEDLVDGADWKSMETPILIESGAVSNKMIQVQQYLWQRGQRSQAGHQEFLHTALKKVLWYLASRDMQSTTKLLAALGVNVVAKLWEFVLFSKDVSQRDFIVNYLIETGCLSEDQKKLLEYHTELNTSYPNPSFVSVKELRHEDRSWQRQTDLSFGVPQYDHSDLHTNTGELFPIQTEDNTALTQLRYSQVLIHWLVHWSLHTRQRILLDAAVNDQGEVQGFDSGVLWDFYQSHADSSSLLNWLKTSVDNKTSSTELPPLPEDGLDNLSHCPGYMKQLVLDYCARYGMLGSGMLTEFTEIVKQLVRVGAVMTTPHPLHDSLPLQQLHQHFMEYCVKENLPSILWDYMEYYHLDTSLLDSVDDVLTNTWLPLFIHFYNLSQNPSVQSNMLKASLSNTAFINKATDGKVEDELIKSHPLAAIATALMTPVGVDSLITRKRLLGRPVPPAFEKELEKYPKLCHSLFPASVAGLEKTDVSVYQLLQKGAPFCPTRLFGWQTTNDLATGDCLRDLPYFSHPELVKKYAPVIKLRYTYYLRQARPSFAFVSFLAQELDSGLPSISKRRVSSAYRVATVTAIRHLTNSPVVSACTAFVEMLGEDSIYLRTFTHVAHTILLYKNTGLLGPAEVRKETAKKNEHEVVELMRSCLRRRRGCSNQVLTLLEEAIQTNITSSRLSSFSFDAAYHWNLAILFCQQARLPYSVVFLEGCARGNQWLPFVWFSQIHQYPKQQLHGLLHMFPSRALREHLHYVIENAQVKSLEMGQRTSSIPKTPTSQRDIRHSLYTRIGLAKGKPDNKEQESSSSEEEEHQLGVVEDEGHSITDDEVCSVKLEAAPEDIFGVVFAAMSSKCQWKCLLSHSIILRNPLFSVLAASFQDASRLACLSSWLVATMDQTTSQVFLEEYGSIATRWTLVELRILIDIYIEKSWTSALATGFDIFQMDSPLLPFLMFYAEFVERKQFHTSRKMLESFKEAMFAFRQSGKKLEASHGQSEMTQVLGCVDWLEQVSYSAICHYLTRGDNQYEIKIFLSILEQVNIAPVFSFPVPDYGKLHKLLKVSVDCGLTLPCTELLESGSTEYAVACETAVSTLKSQSLFEEARQFATIAGLNTDHITVKQVAEDVIELRASSLWNSRSGRHRLWRNCLDTFKLHQVDPTIVADFFQDQISICDLDQNEQAYLYQLSYDCLSEGGSDQKADIYMKLWRCKLQVKQQQLEGTSPSIKHLKNGFEMEVDSEPSTPKTPTPRAQWDTELLQYGRMPKEQGTDGQQEVILDDREKRALDELIGELLNEGQIRESCKLTTVFNHYNQDLALILSCMRLASGVISIEELELALHKLLTKSSAQTVRRTRKLSFNASQSHMTSSTSQSSLSSFLATAMEGSVIDEEGDKVVVMEKLLDNCKHGYSCCLRVIVTYRISLVLEMDYEDIVSSKDFEILEKLLLLQKPQKFSLAKNFLKTGYLTDAEVAGFLSDAIVHSLHVLNNLGQSNEGTGNRYLIFDPQEGGKEFYHLVHLCQDPSVLGDRLLDAVAALAGTDTSPKVLSIQTELLIRAHDCHSVACNMEGISNTLRAARVLTECLTRAEEFTLMVRLLTGVGRYSEMSYIFDALKQNHQFELLLRKDMEKEDRLKVAMLDYLKRFHSTDSDSYTMVALKFTMYREIALMLEECAIRHLTQLKTQALENNSETKNTLEKIVQYFSDAAESYIKDNCMRHAQVCVKQARLVALQIHLLSSSLQLINLTPSSASSFIRTHNRFTEAYIVSEAYNRKTDWPAALCTNFLINGDAKYFTDFKSYVKMTPSLISETIDRYDQTANKSSQSIHNVRKLLSCCKDLRVKYQLAKDQRLTDLVNELEAGDCGSYLLDVFL